MFRKKVKQTYGKIIKYPVDETTMHVYLYIFIYSMRLRITQSSVQYKTKCQKLVELQRLGEKIRKTKDICIVRPYFCDEN